MPVSVTIPTKIRVDRKALACHPEWIEERLAGAASRALANSRKTVLEARGGSMGVNLHPPTFQWIGLAVPQKQRSILEDKLSDLLAMLAERERVGVIASENEEDVLPSNPFEPYNEARGYRMAGLYVLPSYGGEDEVLPVANKPPLADDFIQVVKVAAVPNDEEAQALLDDLKLEASEENPCGIIQMISFHPTLRWRVVITDGEKTVGAFGFTAFYQHRFEGPGAEIPLRKVPFEPPPSEGSAELIDVPNDLDGRRALARQVFGERLREALERFDRKPPKLTTDQWLKYVDSLVDKQIEHMAKNISVLVTHGVRVTMGSATAMVFVENGDPAHFAWKHPARLVPVIAFKKAPKKDGGGGAGGGPGGKEGGQPDGSPGGSQSGRGSTGTGDCPRDDREYEVPDDSPSLNCEPLRGEPALDEIGDAGVLLGKLIAQIADRLGIPQCPYAGQFCYHAAHEILMKAGVTPLMTETSVGNNKPAAAGNLGPIDFTPSDSPIIAEVRRLGEIVAMLTELIKTTINIFESDYYRCTIHGFWRGRGTSWALHLLQDVAPVLKEAVGAMIVGASRSMLIQLLTTSHQEIEKRQRAIERYAPVFEKWIVPLITEEAELKLMLQALRDNEKNKIARQVTVIAAATQQQWLSAAAGLVAFFTTPVTRSAGFAFQIIEGVPEDRIRDFKGVLWSAKELEQAISMKRNLLEGIDPLMKQIKDTPEALERFKNTDSIREELDRLLADMIKKNEEMQRKADSDPLFAFKASSISEDIPQATVEGSKYNLQGIHKIAHEQIADAFKGSSYYAMGIDWVFDTELGARALKGAGIMIGMVALCVFVPGGGFIAFVGGGALAAHELEKVYEKERLYGALIDPDKVINYADLEVEKFVAWFGLVVSMIPEAGTAVKGIVAGSRAVVKSGVRGAAKQAGRAAASRVSKELAEYAAKDLLKAFITETSINMVMDQVIQQAMKPIIGRVHERVAALEGSGAVPEYGQEARAFIDMILSSELVEE